MDEHSWWTSMLCGLGRGRLPTICLCRLPASPVALPPGHRAACISLPLPSGWKHKALQGRLQFFLYSQLILTPKLPVPGSLQRGGAPNLPPPCLQLRDPLGITSHPRAGCPPTQPTTLRTPVVTSTGSNPQPKFPGLPGQWEPSGLAFPRSSSPLLPSPSSSPPTSHPQSNCGFCLGNALCLTVSLGRSDWEPTWKGQPYGRK